MGLCIVIGSVVAVILLRGGGTAVKNTAGSRPLGSWSAQPNLGNIRGTTAVVRLQNGQILAAGGGVGAIPVSSAEIYDPQTHRWTPTGSLQQARRGAGAVLLADGRVLLAGGVGSAQLLSSAEIFDPGTGRWTPTGSMTTPRLGGTLTLLPSGDVLAAGGTSPSGQQGTGGGQTISPTSSAEIYHAATGTWTLTGSMTAARFEASGTLLSDGRVLIAGGFGGPGAPGGAGSIQYNPLASTEGYDPAVGAFSATGQMINARADHVAARLADGTVLVAGGLGGSTGGVSVATAERFDPTTGRWREVSPMIRARTGASAALLGNGRVLVAGGESVEQGVRNSLDSAELFDANTSTWLPAGIMSCPRSGLGAVTLSDGSVLEVAGDGAFPGQPPVAQSCVERYFPGPAGPSGT
ncbi:MAG TPA: kelch repeat-containing protein [Actinomycetota bacterium]